MRANSDFMVLDALFYVIFVLSFNNFQFIIVVASVCLNKLTVNIIRNINITQYRHPRVQNHKVAVRTHASAVLND